MYGDYIVPNENLTERLIRAIKFDNLEEVFNLVSAQVDINTRDSSDLDWTPLMYAVHQESLRMVKLLVESGADVNAIGSEPDDFALNLAAYACKNYFPYSYQHNRNKEIFDYLAPLTLPNLQEIAKKTLTKKL